MKLAGVCFLAALLFLAPHSGSAAPRSSDFLRVEYYPWEMIKDPAPYRAPLEHVDVLIYFKAEPDDQGRLKFPGGMLEHLARLKQVTNPKTRFWLGLGSLDRLAQHGELVEVFLKDLRAACRNNGFVGIDFDWEGDNVKLDDYERIVKRISRDLRSRDFGVSISVGASGHYRQKAAKVIDDVDWVNVQFYYSTQNSMSVADMAAALAEFRREGVPNAKLCAGLPAYGMVDMRKDREKPRRTWAYKDLLQAGADPLQNLWRNPGTGVEYHYSGTPLIQAKTAYLRQEGYRGVFTWYLALDASYDSPHSILRTIDQTVAEGAAPRSSP
jgi:GH18 family chitinase